ncbi:hypothetical protein H4687_008960 [Streptomyces stelliscabiei]|uniref:Transposase n=1 Tax=Streptomyces stelliscabiei TaxID=146820 RepID=A0A8I0PAF3_9ACTN|nr:hypothetical protein [Streptomyces stelliscabiei]
MLRVPKYRASLVDPCREHLRKRRAEDPAVPVQHLFEEIKTLGFTGCLNLLHKYINQGRADADRSHISPCRLARMLLTRPDNLKREQHELLVKLTAACPEMTQLAAGPGDFAPLLTQHPTTPMRSRTGSPKSEQPTCPTSTPSPGAWTGTSTP